MKLVRIIMPDLPRKDRTRVAELAEKIYFGKIDLLEGVRELSSLAPYFEGADSELLAFIVGVESELEDIPSTEERLLWNNEALKEKDSAAKIYLESVSDEIRRTCRLLMERYSP